MLDISTCAKHGHSGGMDHKAITLIKWFFLAIGLGLLALAIPADNDAKLPLTLMGLAFAGVGGGLIAYGRYSVQKEADLRQNGQLVEAEFQQVEVNTSLEVNGANPFRIVAQWHDTANDRLHVFRSANLWFDPTDHVQEWIPVYIDLKNPKRYHMDTSFLPKLQR
jgi:hypothetical protein